LPHGIEMRSVLGSNELEGEIHFAAEVRSHKASAGRDGVGYWMRAPE
jgi:hypothetical protein